MNTLNIGWASRDVSTDAPITVPGQFHMRISEGVHDPVTVTSLVIDNEEDMVIFVSADIVVVRAGLLDAIRKKVTERNPDIPATKILLNATHTHTGPSTYGEQPAMRSVPHDGVTIAPHDEYREFFVEQTAEAIVEAHAQRNPGGIAYGYGYAVVGHSRRTVYMDDVSTRPGAVIDSAHGVDGHARMYGNTNDDQFSHYEAGADHFVNLLYTFDGNEKLTGAIINVPCPAQNSEGDSKLSASFWNEARDAVREEHGDIHILGQCAAGGDQSPRVLHYQQAEQRRFRLKYGGEPESASEMNARKDIGERIAGVFSEVLSWARRDIQTELPISHAVETIQLSKRLVTQEQADEERQRLSELEAEEFKTDGAPMENLCHNSGLVTKRARSTQIVSRFEEQEKEPTLATEIHVLRLGDIAFASNQFELYIDFMHRIQARSPFVQTFIVQLAGVPGPVGGSYLATDRAAWGRGYGASQYDNLVSPQGGQELVEKTVAALEAASRHDTASGG